MVQASPGSTQIERAVEDAARRSAHAVGVRHETDWLIEHGGIAAQVRS